MKKKGIKKRVFIILSLILLSLGLGLALYAHRNMTYDQKEAKLIEKAQFQEKQVTLPDHSILNYGEGPDNGEVLVLLHGQQVSWEDYAKVLGELSQRYHIYAVDYYGHGGSSKSPEKYSAKAIGQDLICLSKTSLEKPFLFPDIHREDSWPLGLQPMPLKRLKAS
ncbi:alpha/beta fold hydrolase [Streptococcus henryi]|uniref:alpha/beta fold hydrolase n=1 Tax=Streptococcus henryi TaxID=439219 RepID=UPI00200B43F8|nr:alpha/beta hydrolase [Streptococcus henryi]